MTFIELEQMDSGDPLLVNVKHIVMVRGWRQNNCLIATHDRRDVEVRNSYRTVCELIERATEQASDPIWHDHVGTHHGVGPVGFDVPDRGDDG